MAARSSSLPPPKSIRGHDGTIELLSPGVGLWRDAPAQGSLLAPGDFLGQLEVLGVLHPIFVPEGAAGLVQPTQGARLARRPVAWGDRLVVLDPRVGAPASDPGLGAATMATHSTLHFPSPSAGRVYLRPSPDKPPFLGTGELVHAGQTVCLLEVMKTFTRIHYGGADLPAHAKVLRVVPHDQDDIAAGDPILELESAE